MTIFSGKMSSESDDRSNLAPSETNAQGLSKQSKIRYTRAFLVSQAKLTTGKGLPSGIEPSILCELDFRLDGPLQASYISDSESCNDNLHKGLLNTDNVGLLGPGALLGIHGDIADASPPSKVEESVLPLLHKSKEPYRPPHLLKADCKDYKDEVWVSPECLSKSQGLKQNWTQEFPEVMREQPKDAFEKQKKNTNEHDKNIEFIMPLEESEKDEINDSLGPEHSDTPAEQIKSPTICCSELAPRFPAIEEKLAYGISCTEGSESIANGISNEHSINVPDEHLKSTTDETSKQYGCKIPAVILGVLACVGLEHVFKPETKEISSSMLWDGCDADDGNQDSGIHHGSHQLLLLPENRTEQKDITASPELNIPSDELHPGDTIIDNKKSKLLSQGNGGQCEMDMTREPVYGPSFTKGLQLTDESSCIRQSYVGRSTKKTVSKTCKFFFPVANENHLASAVSKYKPSEDIVFSSSTDQSKGMENQSVSDDLKPNHLCCSDEKDTFPLELCLPDEDSLITVDDFRVVSYKDIVERNQVKADGVCPSPPVDTSRKPMDTKIGIKDEKSTHVYKSEAPVCQGNTPYRASPALINSQVKAINPKFKPQNTSNRSFTTNVLPTTFHQQLQPTLFPPLPPPTTTYMQEQYHVQAFPWNYQVSGYGCVPMVPPGFQPYGWTNRLGTQSNAGTGYDDLSWQ